MALSNLYQRKASEIAKKREELAIERARSSIEGIMQSEQFKLSAIALPESRMAVDAIVTKAVSSVLNPVAQMVDTLRAKGFRQAEIRKLVHNLHDTYNLKPDTPDPSYDDMVGPVADWLMEHQELYNSFDPEMLRGS